MLRAYLPGANGATCVEVEGDSDLPAAAVWIDMISPTAEEERRVEAVIGVEVPTRDEMAEIEPSSRLYQEPGAIFLTANLVSGVDSGNPISTAVSFVLTANRLVTVRYAQPKVFELFSAHVDRAPGLCADAGSTLINLLDAIVDRLADVLEGVGDDLDNISRSTFRRSKGDKQQRMTTAAR
ncbi:MAG: CorA family divalent cation transporter, partial [Polymorphobacter sp.]